MATRPRSAGDRVGRRPQLAVEELGRGEPLVLLHGLATTRQIWNPVVSLLAARRRVVTVDLPGFGESPAVGPGFDLHCVAEGLVRGLTARRVTAPFDLVGHSLGGAVAVTVAADQPKLVSRLVLVAPAGFATAPALPVAVLAAGVDAMFAARRWLAPLTDLALGRKLLLSMAVADGAAIAPTQARLMVQASAHASRIAAAFEAVACADLRPALRSVDAPLGLIWGELDRTIAPRTATHLMADRPDAQLEVVAGAGHVPMVERPSAFAAAVIQLLQDLPKHATSPARAPVSCGEQGLMQPVAIDRHAMVRLAHGRRLRYLQTGPPDGLPVFYCHGAIGTSLEQSVDLKALTERLAVRYIAVNRPGLGGSDPAPGRRVRDFAADLEQLADALRVERFAVIGVSAGGPYALAAGSALRDRVIRISVCSSLSPLCAPHRTPGMAAHVRAGLGMLAALPALCAAAGDAALPLIRRNPELLHRIICAHAAPAERARLRESEERLAAASSFFEATAYGVRGMVDDYCCYARGWGFETATVSPEVQVWHGARDPLVPLDHALALAMALPRCRMFLHPDEGHHFFRRRLPEILSALVDRDRAITPS